MMTFVKFRKSTAAFLFAACFFLISIPAIHAEPLDLSTNKILNFKIADTQTRFGSLEFTGGIVIQSNNRDFGGISGLRLFPDRDQFLAVTDAGSWISGEIERDVAGAPHDIQSAQIGQLADPQGNFFTRKRNADCEALEIDGSRAWLAFERNHRIASYPLVGSRIEGDPQEAFPQIGNQKLKNNAGIEALALRPASATMQKTLIALSEESLDEAGNHRGFLLNDAGISELSVLRRGEFGITDAAFMPDGDLLILERSFSITAGPGMRIRRIVGSKIQTGAILDGEVLIEVDNSYRIDNMEGLAVSTSAAGETFITLISDDNFSPLQSTLLLEFKLVE